jgi:hypothetical protein
LQLIEYGLSSLESVSNGGSMSSIGRITTAPTVEVQASADRSLKNAIKKIDLALVKKCIGEHANLKLGIYIALETRCNYTYTAYMFPTKHGPLVQSCKEAITKLDSIIAFLETNYPSRKLSIPQGKEIGLREKLDRGLNRLNCELVWEAIDAHVDVHYAYEKVLLARYKWIKRALLFQEDENFSKIEKECCNNYKKLAPLFETIKHTRMKQIEMQATLLDSGFSSSASSTTSPDSHKKVYHMAMIDSIAAAKKEKQSRASSSSALSAAV